MATKLKVAVVPEHFSLPWHLGLEKGIFNKHNVDVQLEEFPRGTGSMCRALRMGEIDIAVALTEGVIADIASNGPEIQIIATYIDSPLHWGIIVSKNSPINSVEQLKGKKFGISRLGSGSHLMAFLLADQNNWDVEKDVTFVPKGGLTDLLQGIQDETTDTFLWETFTVKPYHDQVKQIGEIVTPWPCFVVCARSEILKQYPNVVENLLNGIKESCSEFTRNDGSLEQISRKCHLNIEDSKKWFQSVKFSNGIVSKKVLENTSHILVKTGALKSMPNIDSLCNPNIAKIVN